MLDIVRSLKSPDKKKLQPKDYEKHGYLGHQSFIDDVSHSEYWSGVSQYGDVIFHFNKEKLIDTTTDSLGPACNKDLIAGNVKQASFNAVGINDFNDYKQIMLSKEVSDLSSFVRTFDVRYIELQYHGDITLDCVDSACFTKDIPNLDVIKRLKEKHIKVFRIEEDKYVEM